MEKSGKRMKSREWLKPSSALGGACLAYSRKDGGQRGCCRRVREGGRWWVREVGGKGDRRVRRS